jgi:hypothetical protein
MYQGKLAMLFLLPACLPGHTLTFTSPPPLSRGHFASSPAYKPLIAASHSHSPIPQTTHQPIQTPNPPPNTHPHTRNPTPTNPNQPQPTPTCQPGPSAKNSPTLSPPWKPPASSLTSKYVVCRPPLSPQPPPLSRALSLYPPVQYNPR